MQLAMLFGFGCLVAIAIQMYVFMLQRTALELFRANRMADGTNHWVIVPEFHMKANMLAGIAKWIFIACVWWLSHWYWALVLALLGPVLYACCPIPHAALIGVMQRHLMNPSAVMEMEPGQRARLIEMLQNTGLRRT